MEHFTDFFQKMFLAGLGAMSISEGKINEVVDDLIKKGEITKEEGTGFLETTLRKMETVSKEMEEKVSDITKKTLDKMNIVSSEEVEKMRAEIELLREKLKKMEENKKK